MGGALNARLHSAAELVRQDAVFADIGTDHAYLPLFLLAEGRISRAVCSDINEGPLNSAKNNAEAAGLSHLVDFRLADGAAELSGMGVTDYAICGMGGELICGIISRAPALYDAGVNLILQPMSRQATLRKFLRREGFSILRESYSYDGGKYYVCLLATYTGSAEEIDDFVAEIGCENTEFVNKSAQIGYLNTKYAALLKEYNGKILGGNNADAEGQRLSRLKDHIDSL